MYRFAPRTPDSPLCTPLRSGMAECGLSMLLVEEMMSQDQWNAVDNDFNELFAPADPSLDATLKAVAEAGMPQISSESDLRALRQQLVVPVGIRVRLLIRLVAPAHKPTFVPARIHGTLFSWFVVNSIRVDY